MNEKIENYKNAIVQNHSADVLFQLNPKFIERMLPSNASRPFINASIIAYILSQIKLQQQIIEQMVKTNSFEWAPPINTNFLPDNARIYKAKILQAGIAKHIDEETGKPYFENNPQQEIERMARTAIGGYIDCNHQFWNALSLDQAQIIDAEPSGENIECFIMSNGHTPLDNAYDAHIINGLSIEYLPREEPIVNGVADQIGMRIFGLAYLIGDHVPASNGTTIELFAVGKHINCATNVCLLHANSIFQSDKIMSETQTQTEDKKKKKPVEGSTEEEAVETPTEEPKEECFKQNIAEKKEGHKSKPSEYANVPDDEFADTTNFKYPLDASRVEAAWNYLHVEKNREAGGYTPDEWATMRSKAKAAMIKHGHIVKEDATIDPQLIGVNVGAVEIITDGYMNKKAQALGFKDANEAFTIMKKCAIVVGTTTAATVPPTPATSVPSEPNTQLTSEDLKGSQWADIVSKTESLNSRMDALQRQLDDLTAAHAKTQPSAETLLEAPPNMKGIPQIKSQEQLIAVAKSLGINDEIGINFARMEILRNNLKQNSASVTEPTNVKLEKGKEYKLKGGQKVTAIEDCEMPETEMWHDVAALPKTDGTTTETPPHEVHQESLSAAPPIVEATLDKPKPESVQRRIP